jgi:hypothetical protein
MKPQVSGIMFEMRYLSVLELLRRAVAGSRAATPIDEFNSGYRERQYRPESSKTSAFIPARTSPAITLPAMTNCALFGKRKIATT